MKKKKSLYECIVEIESNSNYKKVKEEAALVFMLEQLKTEPKISAQELIKKANEVSIQVASLLSSVEFKEYLMKLDNAELIEATETLVDSYYTDPDFEELAVISSVENRAVMDRVIIPFLIKRLFKEFDIDFESDQEGEKDEN